MFSCTMVLYGLYIMSKTLAIKCFKYSDILRPNIGLTDPGPLALERYKIWLKYVINQISISKTGIKGHFYV